MINLRRDTRFARLGRVAPVPPIRTRFAGSCGWAWPAALQGLPCVLIALAVATGCKSSSPEPQTGSETNFLEHCDVTCDEGMTCLCGVCTKACTGDNDCAAFGSGVECVSVVTRPDSGTTGSCQQGATCDKSCLSTSNCASLGPEYQCETGFCRKGALVCPDNALPPGDTSRDILVNDTSRSYLLHVPSGYSGSAAVPLVIDFHPIGLDAQWERTNSGFLALSDQEGFIVAWPQGLEGSWNVGPCCTTSKTIDDFGFARALVRQLSTEVCVDPKRVYAVAVSGGGAMAYYAACKEAEIFASIAVSSMDLFADSELTCQPSRAVAEISFRGTADTVVPYAGGASSVPGHPEMVNELLGATGTFQKWAAIDQCTGSPTAEDANGCSTYSTCQDGTEVTLCTVQGGVQIVGDANLAWAMLAKHPMP